MIRHDQGGDIVSEGQAYGMLIAEVAGRPALVRTIWSWTDAHLGRSDGLFASHANGSGQVEDPHSATDADILIAYALLRYAGPDQDALHRAGRRVASAVLAQRIRDAARRRARCRSPGPWAKSTSPPTVDPSYLMPSVFAALAALTGDDRWIGAAGAAVTLIGDADPGRDTSPARLGDPRARRLVPIANPGGGAGVQYGFDAARLPIWFATGCSAGARGIAASWWRSVLGSTAAPAHRPSDSTAPRSIRPPPRSS